MSTKTTFKRIALVAVAALGLGVLSVAPSSATVSALTVTDVPVVVSDETVVEVSCVVAPAAPAVTVVEIGVACDGTTDITPRPKAATATSATRLNVVFVDICFLSIVELRTIRGSALELVS